MSADRPTIFVVDDDAVRWSLARLLGSEGWDVETFPSARDFLARETYSGTGCAVLDVRKPGLPGLTGIELQDKMSAHGISLPIVFLTGHGNVPMSVQAMKKGAVDFLLKPVDDETLLRTVREAIERHAVEKTDEYERHEIETRLSRLSSREREVMEFVIWGHLNKQIAAELGIAEKTVKAHRGRVMAKMEADSVIELARMCRSAGIEAR